MNKSCDKCGNSFEPYQDEANCNWCLVRSLGKEGDDTCPEKSDLQTSSSGSNAPDVTNGANDFPPAARCFLNAFYAAKSATSEADKITALKQTYSLGNTYLSLEGLKVLEFYALTKQGII